MESFWRIITWPFRALWAGLLFALKPAWLSAGPFLKINAQLDNWLGDKLGPLGALIALFTPMLWGPLFIFVWVILYAVIFYVISLVPGFSELLAILAKLESSLKSGVDPSIGIVDFTGIAYLLVAILTMFLDAWPSALPGIIDGFDRLAGPALLQLYTAFLVLAGLRFVMNWMLYMWGFFND